MYIPVFPNTGHPSRKPLMPSDPLPIGWTHCCHASFETITVRVPVRYAKNPVPTMLSIDSMGDHISAVLEDEVRMQKLKRAVQGVIKLPPMAESQEYAPSSWLSEDYDYFDAPRQSISSHRHSLSSVSLNEDDTSKPVPPPFATISYNLASVPTVAEPQDLLAEMKFIERYSRHHRDAVHVSHID